MAQFIMLMALHYQIVMQPMFRPSMEFIRGHEIIRGMAPREGVEMRPPDGALIDWRIKW